MGRRDKGREDILRFLRARFGPVAEDLAKGLARVGDPAALDRLIDAAAVAASVAEFRAALDRELAGSPAE